MRKIRFVKVVIPEIVYYIVSGDEKLPDYRCPECGNGVAEEYLNCPYCGSELDWKTKDKKSEEFQKLIDRL